MAIIRLPQYFEVHQPQQVTQLPAISMVRYRQSQHQHRNEVYLSRHLLIFVQKGKKILHQNAQVFHTSAGEGIFIKAGCYAMSEIVPSDDDFQSLLFFIDPTLIADFLRENHMPATWESTTPTQPVCKLRVTERLAHYLTSVTELKQLNGLSNPNYSRLKSMELLFQLLLDPENNAVLQFLLSLQQSKTTLLQTTMEQYFDRPLTLEDYARLTARSLASFKRDFEKHYGTSPGKWLRERRLQQAYYLLRFTDKTVTAVCFDCGFENLSHFAQVFKKRFGFSPKATALQLPARHA